MTGKEYMNEIRKIRREIRLLYEQIIRDELLASNVKAIRYDVDKVQTSPDGDRMAELISDICKNESKMIVKVQELHKREESAMQVLLLLKEEHERILVLHYLEGKRWEDVAAALFYDETYIYKLRDRALDELTEVLKTVK